jgi:hypothetical protein
MGPLKVLHSLYVEMFAWSWMERGMILQLGIVGDELVGGRI